MFLMNPFIPLSKQCSSCTDRTDNYTHFLNPHLAQLFPFLPHDRHPLVGQSRSSTCSSPSVAALCAGSSMKLKLKCRSRIWVNSSSYNTVAVDARHNFRASVQGCCWEWFFFLVHDSSILRYCRGRALLCVETPRHSWKKVVCRQRF